MLRSLDASESELFDRGVKLFLAGDKCAYSREASRGARFEGIGETSSLSCGPISWLKSVQQFECAPAMKSASSTSSTKA
jgi:hypothetical protein